MTTPLTPGLAQAGIALMDTLGRMPLTARELLSGLQRVDRMPAAAALELAQSLNWLAVDEHGVMNASPAGLRLAACSGYEAALRQILLDCADVLAPDWVQNATWGRSRVLAFCPVGVRQVMVEAGLAADVSDAVVEFWDDLAALARGRRDDRLLAIGRRGERLSLAHEQARTGMAARWTAIDSNQDGFDILSVRSADDRRPLSIEVKASTVTAGLLHLSRNEWDQALDSPFHAFHLWDLSGLRPRLAVVTVEAMAIHMPVDVGNGEWREVRAPMSAFADLFEPSAA